MDTPPCVDLRDYADRYRVLNELEGRRAHQADDAWDLIIPGRGGFVAPYGHEHLLACTRGIVTTRKVLALDPEALVTQHASDGQNVRFHTRHLNAVAKVLRLRRRQLSDEHKARLAEAGRGSRFPGVQATGDDALAGENAPDGPEAA